MLDVADRDVETLTNNFHFDGINVRDRDSLSQIDGGLATIPEEELTEQERAPPPEVPAALLTSEEQLETPAQSPPVPVSQEPPAKQQCTTDDSGPPLVLIISQAVRLRSTTYSPLTLIAQTILIDWPAG